MSASRGIRFFPCIQCGHKATKVEVWRKKGLCTNCGARKETEFAWCLNCRKKNRVHVARQRARNHRDKLVEESALRFDRRILELQRERISRGLEPSKSLNPLRDKALPIRLET